MVPVQAPRLRDDAGLFRLGRRAVYYEFEGAFSLADGWLLSTVIAAAVQLWRGRAATLLSLLAAGGAGLCLLGMDVFYDLRHRIYGEQQRA
jgi:hypothetical protein